MADHSYNQNQMKERHKVKKIPHARPADHKPKGGKKLDGGTKVHKTGIGPEN